MDETSLKTGKLEVKGVENLKALSSISVWQKLFYDFQFSQIEFQTDYPVVIFSVGRSCMGCDCELPLSNPLQMDQLRTVKFQLNETDLDILRNYLAIAKTLNFNIEEEKLGLMMQSDFALMRKEDPTIPSDSFHLWLTVARLHCQSLGVQQLTEQLWKDTLKREVERWTRIKQKLTSTKK